MKTNGGNRLESLDVLRGLAILLLIWHHLGQGFLFHPSQNPFSGIMSETWFGVEIFFVISGFVVCRMFIPKLDDARKKGKTHVGRALKKFYTERAFRLLPLCWFWLVVYLGISVILNPNFFERTSRIFLEIFSVLTFSNNFFANVFVPTSLGWHWSLSVEEQFYLLLPPLLIFLPTSKSRIIVFSTYIVLVNVILRPWVVSQGAQIWPTLRTASYLKFDSIFLGCLIYLISETTLFKRLKMSEFVKSFRRTAMSTFFYAGFISLPFYISKFPSVGFAILNLISFGLVWIASVEFNQTSSSIFKTLMAAIGRRSYVLYLAHLPVFLLTSIVMNRLQILAPWARLGVVLLILPPATEFCFRWIEQPMIRTGKKFSSRWAAHLPT